MSVNCYVTMCQISVTSTLRGRRHVVPLYLQSVVLMFKPPGDAQPAASCFLWRTIHMKPCVVRTTSHRVCYSSLRNHRLNHRVVTCSLVFKPPPVALRTEGSSGARREERSRGQIHLLTLIQQQTRNYRHESLGRILKCFSLLTCL